MRLVITYHDIAPDPLSPWCVAPDVFREHLTTLQKTGFELVSLDQLIAEPQSSVRLLCAITFDDGRLGAFQYGATILEEYGVRGTFFVCPSFIDRLNVPVEEQYSTFISWDDVRALVARGHCVGSHGMRHMRLSELSKWDARLELAESKARIERETGRACKHFAAPHGDITQRAAEIARSVGYEVVASISTEPGPQTGADGILPRWQVHWGDDFKKLLYTAGVREPPCLYLRDCIIRHATDSDDVAVNQVFNQAFNAHRTLAEYRWKFRQNPWATEFPLRTIVCERHQQLVGIYSLMPTLWQFNDSSFWTVHALDICIVEESRQIGILNKMHSLMCRTTLGEVKFGFGFPGARAFLVGTNALDYRALGNFTRTSMTLNGSRVESMAANYQVTLIERFGDDHDLWWKTVGSALFPIIIPRTSRYLNWRFVDHPLKKYQILSLGGPDGTLGYAVVGFAAVNGGIVATIHDFLCIKDPPAITSLIRACIELAQRYRARSIQCWMFQHAPYSPFFEASGFCSDQEADLHFIISSWHDEEFENRCIASASDWYVTIGDSDI